MAQDVSPFGPAAPVEPTRDDFWTKLDRRFDRWSEWLNPILVKEARQAFKSNQFLVTFLLMLAGGWIWSIIGVLAQMPGVQFGSGGTVLLGGYYLIVALPMLIVVPFSAFRSLAAEREDGTFEILSITTLSAGQIVLGKFTSALLQMMVYYSALSPCIAFTYLLRGMDVVTILMVLVYTFALSVLMTCVSLVTATITRSRNWQVLFSVVLILLLALVGLAWSSFVYGELLAGWTPPSYEPEFWPANLTFLSAIAGLAVLCLVVARGQISFASDNRSGPVRWVLLGHQVVFLGWTTYWIQYDPPQEFVIAMFSFAAVYWYLVGALLVGESAQLSPRVRRELPRTLLGRMTKTWFNPGSGTGYMFVLSNLGVVLLFFLLLGFYASLFSNGRFKFDDRLVLYMAMAWAYVAIYLGVVRSTVVFLKRWMRPNLIVSLLLGLLYALAGCAFPYFVELSLAGYVAPAYTGLQFTNWMWTLVYTADNVLLAHPSVPTMVGVGAWIWIVAQWFTMEDELFLERAAAPQRVVEDDLARKGAGDAEPQPLSPWD